VCASAWTWTIPNRRGRRPGRGCAVSRRTADVCAINRLSCCHAGIVVAPAVRRSGRAERRARPAAGHCGVDGGLSRHFRRPPAGARRIRPHRCGSVSTRDCEPPAATWAPSGQESVLVLLTIRSDAACAFAAGTETRRTSHNGSNPTAPPGGCSRRQCDSARRRARDRTPGR
jgi:hypothetical protein